MTNILKKIINDELPAEKIFENERILVIKDINPRAPVHLLILPKKEIPDLQSVSKEDLPLISEIIELVQKLSVELGCEEYRLLTNNGATAGQSIYHLHFHMIGGANLGPMA